MYESRGDFDATRITGALWERQPCDTPKSWAAFQIYRDAGPDRSMSSIAEQVGVKTKLLLRWSSRYAWVMRTDAYDNHLSMIKQDMVQRAISVRFAAEAEKTAETLVKAKTIVMHDLDVLVRRAEDPEMGDELLLNNKTMVQLMDRVVMLERIVTGQPTSKSMVESRVDRTERTVKHVIVDDNRKRDPKTITIDPVESATDDGSDGEPPMGGALNGGTGIDGGGSPPHSRVISSARQGPRG
jgi:hypothetical protein